VLSGGTRLNWGKHAVLPIQSAICPSPLHPS
jgi:hypothetical protein